jgi:hypothetical protein
MSDLDRRRLLGTLAGLGLSASAAAADRERIKAENDREGTTDWQLTYTRIDPKTRCQRFGGGRRG